MQQPGGEIGSYQVGESIGHGGMGVVYRAVHKDLDREVALKVLAPQFSADEEYRQRFLSEARTLARLESNHIVAIYDAGQHEGSLYLAMQLVTDGDLSAWLGSYGPMPPAVALDLLRQVTEGLGTAHDAGVLHRDIKASNVLLRRLSDGSTRAYLCDFGIAQTADVSHTRTGGVVGTWAYLAPERHQGVPASQASDIYALGCLLWAMLTGSTPYAGVTDVEVAIAHMNAPVPQIPGGSPEVRALNHLLSRLLDKDPARRLGSADAVLDDLDQVAQVVGSGGAPLPSAGGAGRGGAPQRTGGSRAATAPDRSVGSRGSAGSGGFGPPAGGGRTQAASYGGAPGHAPRKSKRTWIAAAVAVVLVVAGGVGATVLLNQGDEGGGGGGGGEETTSTEVPFADDTQPGIIADATLTTTPCEDSPGGLRVTGLLPETGILAQQSPPAYGGLGLAVSDINDAGGVLDEPVCQAVVDSADGDALTTVQSRDFATDVVIGPIQSELADTVVPVLDEEEIVSISPSAWINDRSGASPYAFRTIGDMTTMGDALARMILRRVDAGDGAAIVTADENFSIRSRDAIQTSLEQVGITCAFGCTGAGQDIPEDTVDFAPVVANVLASGAEVVVSSGYLDGSALLTALSAAGWTGPVYFSAVSDTEFVNVPADILANTGSIFPAKQAPQEFLDRVQDWYSLGEGGSVPTPFLAAESYDAVVLAALAATRGGGTDSETIADNMRAVSGSEGGTQCATFRRCAALLEADEEIVYRGVSGGGPINEDNDLTEALFSSITFDETGAAVRAEEQVQGRKR
ncbi:protein kinase domain-containing protein [Nocardioides alkalitolerans]|uniref:protein kinase domain-containing protein n=1 Tax=Nocardioides alkalitolerans TaxID=281714 RepID=UPI00041EFE80|nr:protein kinase [Nocardioides alkalitolerans]